MWSLGALLLTACLAVSADPVPTLPDNIQVQENFDVSRVRLASGVTAVSSWGYVLPASGSRIWNSGVGP